MSALLLSVTSAGRLSTDSTKTTRRDAPRDRDLRAIAAPGAETAGCANQPRGPESGAYVT
jgi:hypothetical protein